MLGNNTLFIAVARRFKTALSSVSASRLRRNFVAVLRANVLAQIVAIAVAPLLSRLYTPADFGVIAVFAAAFSLAGAVATGRLDWSIPNTSSEQQAVSLFKAGFVVLCLTSGLLMFVIAIRPAFLAGWVGFDMLGHLIWLLPVTVFGFGINQLLQGWFVRANNLIPVSRMAIVQSLGNATISLLLGVLQFGAAGLIVATMVAAWLGIGMLVRHAVGLFPAVFTITVAQVLSAARHFWKEGSTSSAVSLVNASSTAAPVVMLAMFFSVQEVGWYSLMLRMAAAPVGVIGNALSQSFWARSSELVRAGDYQVLTALYLKVIKLLALVSVPVVLACFAGPYYVTFIFGSDWQGAGSVLFALSPMLVGITVFSSTNHLIVFGRQDLQLIGDGVRLAAVIASIYIANSNEWGFLITVWMVSFSSLLGYVLLFYMHRYVHRNKSRSRQLHSS